jgi:hypothetical protein
VATTTRLRRSNVPFRWRWEPPPLAAWEGPFDDPHQRLPQHPEVAAQQRAAQRAWRERQGAPEAAKLAAERDDAAGALPVTRSARCHTIPVKRFHTN